jgi:hypothetical protein
LIPPSVSPVRRLAGTIEVRIRNPSQLFDTLDPSPFREQDLAPTAEEYIVESVKELHGGAPAELLLHLDAPISTEEQEALVNAIHVHFARRAHHLRLNLRELLRQGLISLTIGLTFLVAVFIAGQGIVRWLGEGSWATLARESLLIGGWVAMWRPLEIFLYAWWPLLAERRLHERLSLLPVRVTGSPSHAVSPSMP